MACRTPVSVCVHGDGDEPVHRGLTRISFGRPILAKTVFPPAQWLAPETGDLCSQSPDYGIPSNNDRLPSVAFQLLPERGFLLDRSRWASRLVAEACARA